MTATIKKLNKHNITVITDNCASREKTKFKCPTRQQKDMTRQLINTYVK